MRKFEITKEQILEVASWGNRQDLVKLREWFPQAFEIELGVGKWYNVKTKGFDKNALICFNNDKLECNYGFNHIGVFSKNFRNLRECLSDNNQEVEPATDKEVETALIAEAKRRGFKEGVKIKPINKVTHLNNKIDLGYNTCFYESENEFWMGGYCLFKDGKWAEICEEPIEVTLEEIAEKFNVNVEQLKIKK